MQSVTKNVNYDKKLPLTFKGAGFLEVRASGSVELELSYQLLTSVEVTILVLQERSNGSVVRFR